MSERNLAKNTVYYTLALATQKVLSFVYFIFVARMIGVEDQGKYSFALSFTAIFAILLDVGMTQILIRETAKDKKNAPQYLANVNALKAIIAIFIYGLVILVINLMGYPPLTKSLVYVSAVVMIMDSFTLSFYGVIRGHQNLKFESFGVVVNQLIVLAAGLIVLHLHLGLVVLISVYLLGSLFNLLFSGSMLKFRFKIMPRFALNRKLILTIVKWSLPFAIAGIFSRIYSSMDMILLSKLSGDHAVGIYSVAYKVAFALQFVALAFSASLYPAFSNYFAHSKEHLSSLFTKSMYWLIILAMPLAFGIIAISDKVIGPVFGAKYGPAVAPLNILMLSLLFIFICFPIGALLNACSRQTRNTVNLGVIALFNVVANLILIPLLSYNGAAISNFLSYALLFILGITAVDKIMKYDKKFLLLSLGKIIVCCAAMFLVVYFLKQYLYFAIVIIIGIAVYLALAYFLKLISPKNTRSFIKEMLNKKINIESDVQQ